MGSRSARRLPDARAPSPEQILRVVDCAYDLACDDDAWVAGLADALTPLVDSGAGVHAFRFDLRHGGLASPVFAGGEDDWRASWREVWWDGLMRRLPGETLRTMVEFGPVSHTTELWAATAAAIPTFEEFLVRGGRDAIPTLGAASAGLRYPDSLNVVARDTSGVGVAFCANRETVVTAAVPKRTRTLLERLVAHVASALRLRRARASEHALDDAEAVVDARGGLVHAAPELAPIARGALRDAARKVLAARRVPADRGPDVLELWRALYGGEFSLLDTFDSDGRRFVIARRNAPGAPSSETALAPRQRRILALLAGGCTNKLIAYELGLAPATVAREIGRLRTLLGAHTGSELVRRARELTRGDEGEA